MDYSFEIREVPEVKTLAIRGTCDQREIGPALAKLYARAGEAMKLYGLKMAGPPYCKYLDWRETDCDIEAGCPVSGEGPKEGDVVEGRLRGGRVLMTRHVGPYDHLRQAHIACMKWVQQNAQRIVDSPWEVYITDPALEPDAAKWITDLYYPISECAPGPTSP